MGSAVLAQAIVSGVLAGSIYSLASIGLTVVFGVLKIVNFAHGELLMLGMYAAYLAWAKLAGLDPFLSLIISIPALFLIGMALYRFLIKPIVKGPEAAQIFLTIGLGLVLQNLALLFFTANYQSVKTVYSSKVLNLVGLPIAYPRILAFGAAVILSVLVGVFLTRTDSGRAMRAAAQDRDVAILMGIDPDKVFMLTMGLGTALAGAAGTVIMPYFYAFPTVGASFSLMSFAVVILGGLGNVKGAFTCGILVGVAESLAVLFIGGDAGLLVAFTILMLTLIFRPHGIFAGKRG